MRTGQQAFTAGYREGVKMSTDKGKPIPANDFNKMCGQKNLRVLSTWCTVGADVENGKYAMLGARMGCIYTVLGNSNEQSDISDIGGMREMFFNKIDANNMDDEIRMYGESI